MPMLYALGQHQALRSVQSHLGAGESLFAFHDDINTVSQPERVGNIHNLLRDLLWTNLEPWRIRTTWPYLKLHTWRTQPGVIGTPLGSDAFVRVQLQLTVDSHRLLFDRIPAVEDLQSTWILLLFCAVSRPTISVSVCPYLAVSGSPSWP